MIASEHAPLIILFAAFMQCNAAIAAPSRTTKDGIIVERRYPLMRHGSAGYRAIVYGGLLMRYPLRRWRNDLTRREISAAQANAKRHSTAILNASPRSSFPMMGGMYG